MNARLAIRKKHYSVRTKRLIRILALGTTALFTYSAETPAQDRTRRNRTISIKSNSGSSGEDRQAANGKHNATPNERMVLESAVMHEGRQSAATNGRTAAPI